jgi:hypothetical protein
MLSCKFEFYIMEKLNDKFNCSGSLYIKGASLMQRNIINSFGLLVLIFAVLIIYAISNPDFQRPVDNHLESIPLITNPAKSDRARFVENYSSICCQH